MNSNSNNFREMFWDESNRLRVVYDQNSYQMQHYIYDAAGERTLKASSKIENVYENGQVESNNTTMGLYTTYVSPYMVVDANQKYSKHYFNGTQRVASKVGEQDIAIFENGNQYLKQANSKTAENIASTDFDTLKNKQIMDFSYYLSKNGSTTKNLKVNYTEYKQVDTNTGNTSAKAADNNSAFAAPQYAEIYYYHSDHLGTGTFLSDFDGNPYQFFLNLPFGETMAEQHSYSGEYTNRYKFNGKELDEETGFYYYGARYYNPKFSIWLSVDPLAEKFQGWNPYNYTLQNPINLIDPDGRAAMAPPRNGIKQFIDNSGVYHWDASKKQYEHYAYTDSSREHYSFSGYYTVNSSSRAVGNASYINGQTTTITEPSFTEKLGNLGREMDAKVRSYEGANGMVRFANDLGKTSTRVKIAGLLVTASSIFLGPEMAPIGVGIFDAGEVLDKTATGLTITKDLSDGKLKTAGIRFASELITTKQDGLINNTIMTEAQKLGGKAGSEVLIESARDSIIKKVNE